MKPIVRFSNSIAQGVVVTLSALALASCGDNTAPTETRSQPRFAPVAIAAAANTWATKAPTISGRSGHAVGVAFVAPSQPRVFAIGGVDENSVDAFATKSVEAYNPTTNSWTLRAPLPIALTHTNGVGQVGGKLYLTGGENDVPVGGVDASRRLYVYDPVHNKWTRKADMPAGSSDGVTGAINGKLYVLQAFPGRLFRYDPVTNAWTTLAQCPQAHSQGAGGVISGKFYVTAGSGTTITNKLNVFDPATNTWTAKAVLPGARRLSPGGAVLNGKLYIIGGTLANGTLLKTVQAYDPVTNAWTTKASMPTARDGVGAATLTQNNLSRIFAVGGGFAMHTNEAYTP